MPRSVARLVPAFTYPLAWIAALTLPALVAIYFLRHRFRRQQVSSLLLWQLPVLCLLCLCFLLCIDQCSQHSLTLL